LHNHTADDRLLHGCSDTGQHPVGRACQWGINLWEFKRTGWEAVKAIKDAHASAVTSATFVEGSAQLALTADAKGRLVSHNVTAYLSITSIFAGMEPYRCIIPS